MPELITEVERLSRTIEIGGMAVRVNTTDHDFVAMLQNRYAGYLTATTEPEIEFDIELAPAAIVQPVVEVQVSRSGSRWDLSRWDFRAVWDSATRRGWIRQAATPYSIDAILRIVHTVLLASQGGVLLHAASAIRDGKAFLFAGVSGAGKTTISRLAPSDVTLLTDEISYIRPDDGGYLAFGTPFTGELAKLGENVSAPVAALYLLAQGHENRIDEVSAGEAARSLLANVLFFAEDEELVQAIFNIAFEFVSRVPILRLTFVPDVRVWEFIR